MFSWYLARSKHTLQLRDVEPENGHDERERNGREEVQILCLSVESGWVLEDGETAGAEREECEPLPVRKQC